ncbi:MAG: capsular biosynthesis protein [Bacteroidia bacterium]|nr:capsular biosynthesis protein [Bacteroidia bacterium]
MFKKEAIKLADFTDVGTDIHSHLIPGIDDGAKTMDETLDLIKAQYALGIRKFVTTPHIMSDFFKNTPEIINGGLAEVKNTLKSEAINVQINAAAEYYIDDGFIQKLENQPLLTFGDKYLLVEISYINCPDNIFDIFFKIQLHGYKVVLAHPERYPYWYKNFEMYQNIRDRGILLQLNINSITGYYGGGAKITAEKLIDQGLIDLIGSDMHHTKHAEAMERVCYEKYFAKVLQLNLLNRHI